MFWNVAPGHLEWGKNWGNTSKIAEKELHCSTHFGVAQLHIGNEKTLSENMGVSENRGTPKWMVYNGKDY